MKKRLPIVILCYLFLAYPLSVNASQNDHLKVCETVASTAVGEFVTANPPRDSKIITAFTAARNDLSYDPPQCMANFLIYVFTRDIGKDYYGIFHIHYSLDGKWVKTSEVSEDEWKISYNKDDWKNYWCNFLSNSIERYKSELKEQGCEK